MARTYFQSSHKTNEMKKASSVGRLAVIWWYHVKEFCSPCVAFALSCAEPRAVRTVLHMRFWCCTFGRQRRTPCSIDGCVRVSIFSCAVQTSCSRSGSCIAVVTCLSVPCLWHTAMISNMTPVRSIFILERATVPANIPTVDVVSFTCNVDSRTPPAITWT